MKIICSTLFLITLAFTNLRAQTTPWKFAHVSDIHVNLTSPTAVEDLRRTVKDINANPELQFVIISGDITEFGADEELKLTKRVLDSLNKPWYIVPGNHDMNWSESGGNSFKKVFGAETFAMKSHGYLFVGTNCGPNMRMSPGQVPRENLVWLDSVLKATPKETPIVFVNHYPIDSALNNWYEIVDRLKTRNTQLIICGHGHSNHLQSSEGIPEVMGRSNLRAKDSVGGYNIVTIIGDSAIYNERTPGVGTKPAWAKVRLYQHNFYGGNTSYIRPGYFVNDRFGNVKVKWSVQDDADIGAGATVAGNLVIITNTAGWVKAYNIENGQQKWAVRVGGKIYSTPAAAGNVIAIACTDNYLYTFDKTTGKILWKAKSGKPIVASPVISGSSVFCGGADGHFKCFDIKTGNVRWDYTNLQGFVVTRPLLYNGMICFGDWNNHFYALDQQTGAEIWNWTNGSANRMFSPAACEPVAARNRLFIIAPDNYMTCFEASTGKVIWRKKDPQIKVRESMGLSADSSLVYVKTMQGDVLGIDAKADSMTVKWKGKHNIGYEISPTKVIERGGLVFATSNSGVIIAFKREDGALAWAHKVSNSLVNPLCLLGDREIVASTMDGKIECLAW